MPSSVNPSAPTMARPLPKRPGMLKDIAAERAVVAGQGGLRLDGHCHADVVAVRRLIAENLFTVAGVVDGDSHVAALVEVGASGRVAGAELDPLGREQDGAAHLGAPGVSGPVAGGRAGPMTGIRTAGAGR